jgi:hypothetical protein
MWGFLSSLFFLFGHGRQNLRTDFFFDRSPQLLRNQHWLMTLHLSTVVLQHLHPSVSSFISTADVGRGGAEHQWLPAEDAVDGYNQGQGPDDEKKSGSNARI